MCSPGHLCPDCQTPEEDAEAVRNFGTWDYESMVQLPDGENVPLVVELRDGDP